MTALGDTALGLISRIPMRAGDGYGGGGGGNSGGSGYGSQYLGGSASGAVGAAVLIAVLAIAIVVFTVKVTKVHRPPSGIDARGMPGSAAPDLDSAREQMLAADPAFDLKAFDLGARRIFNTVQTGWTSRDPELARTVMADGIWRDHQEKIAGYVARGARNRLDLLRIQDTVIRDIRLTPTDQQITVRFVVDSADYVVNDAGVQISGTKKVKSWTEDWVFEREVAAIRGDESGWVLERIDQVAALYPSETRSP